MMLSYRLTGYVFLDIPEREADFIELCRREHLVYDGFESLPTGGIRVTCPLPLLNRVREATEKSGIVVVEGKRGGVPVRLAAFRERPGLVIGFLLSLCLLLVASFVVWDVRISGNTTISDREIADSLRSCGFGVGSSLRHFRADVLESRVLLADERLSWISVNRRGTVAYVQVREAVYPPKPETEQPSDIVASRPGKIVRVELERGNVLVKAGDFVDQGHLLVSGIYDSDRIGFRLTHAKARVFAVTLRECHIEIPFLCERKVYKTAENGVKTPVYCEKRVNFFGKTVKFSKKTGNEGGICDTIEREIPWGLFPEVGFPVSFHTVWHLPYTIQEERRTYEEAEELAYLELSRKIGRIPGGAELLNKRIVTRADDRAFVLDCTLRCIEDIASVRPLPVTDPPGIRISRP